LAKKMGLAVWDRPAASCLASRIPYGTPITLSDLSRIDEAEAAVRAVGVSDCRVRIHGAVARIEVTPEAFPQLLAAEARHHVIQALRSLGFVHIALDLEGYTAGKMNREIRVERTCHDV
jgi:uncharacterized protein